MGKKREIFRNERKFVNLCILGFKLKPSVGIECGDDETVVLAEGSFHFHPLSFSSILSSHALLLRPS